MKQLKTEIDYRFEEIERGGRVRITAKSHEALTAIHEFLRFQIKDHGAADSGDIEKR